MKDSITNVGIDTHKKQHKVCILYPEQKDAQEITVLNNAREIKRFVKRVKKQAPGEIRMCYEAGPCGFDLQRQLQQEGVHCDVIAPSCTPVKPGERIKTDRRDARKLAEYYKSGLLTTIQPPNPKEEAARDLCRCREIAKKAHKCAQQQLGKFLLRHGRIYHGCFWTQKHMTWLRSLKWKNEVEGNVFEDLLAAVYHGRERVDKLDKMIAELAEQEPYREPVAWLRCFRGIDTTTAMVILTELYGFQRFRSPKELMAFLGLTPSEESSGERQKKGGITKSGNQRVRRILIEAAWHQRHRVWISKTLQLRRAGQPHWVIEQADKAMKRLHQRFGKLLRNGKSQPVAVTAVARELSGFIWAILIAPHRAAG